MRFAVEVCGGLLMAGAVFAAGHALTGAEIAHQAQGVGSSALLFVVGLLIYRQGRGFDGSDPRRW